VNENFLDLVTGDLQLKDVLDHGSEMTSGGQPLIAGPNERNEKPDPLRRKLDPRSFPDVAPKRDKKGECLGYNILSTVENITHVLRQMDIVVRYNEMTKAEEILLPGRAFSTDNSANAAVAELTSICRRSNVPVVDLLPFLTLIAEKNRYHPVRDWVLSTTWDGVSRLQALCDTLAVAPEYEKHRNSMIKRWALSAICAAFSQDPSHSFHGTLVLQGAQGLGKTSWFLRLVSGCQGSAKGGMHLNPSSKDSQLEALKYWVVELGELDGNYRKVDINELKGWLTKGADDLRQPYQAKHSTFKRRTVFGATVNESKFLVDSTGNRRWWTIPVLSIDYRHTIDMQQFWAEVYELWNKGGEDGQWHLTKDEDAVLARLNGNHEVLKPMEELLESFFDFDQMTLGGVRPDSQKAIGLNATLISRLLGLGFEGNQVKLNELGKALRKLTGQDDPVSCRGVDGKPLKGWKLVPRDRSLFVTRT